MTQFPPVLCLTIFAKIGGELAINHGIRRHSSPVRWRIFGLAPQSSIIHPSWRVHKWFCMLIIVDDGVIRMLEAVSWRDSEKPTLSWTHDWIFVLFLRSTYIPAQVLTSEEHHKITVYCLQLDYHPNINPNAFRIHCRDCISLNFCYLVGCQGPVDGWFSFIDPSFDICWYGVIMCTKLLFWH